MLDFVFEIMGWSIEHEFSRAVPGDRFTPNNRFGSCDFDVLDITARRNPNDPDRPILVHRLRVPLASHSLRVIDGNQVGVRLNTGAEIEGRILSATSCHRDVEAIDETGDYWKWNLIGSDEIDAIWDQCQEERARRRVYSAGEVPVALRESLQNGINQLAQNELPDYHPNTRQVVRDYVHPSLYPYIRGVSRVTGAAPAGAESLEDFWGRPYEDSIYQWLPAQFFADENGNCSIRSYINNLPQEKYPQLYTDLKRLFDVFLPRFERVCERMESTKEGCELPGLRNRELQVVVKIVDYEFAPGKLFEGVWHVEGMSHENIIATGLYVIERAGCIEGGDLLFKRPCGLLDIHVLEQDMPPSRHNIVDKILDGGLFPAGKLGTQEGAMFVFPNSLVHKVDAMYNSGKQFGRRRIIVFFLVNPLTNIISSRDVAPQQSLISRQDAMQHRLRLMEERKRHKQTWNIRKVELCEH
ncbi:hypothetical protein BSKO_02936 [Bryopsis sp. KO-2023]|nr:hypothetical protein BSKO_02936 [Bryopsis sp. KO-2023]